MGYVDAALGRLDDEREANERARQDHRRRLNGIPAEGAIKPIMDYGQIIARDAASAVAAKILRGEDPAMPGFGLQETNRKADRMVNDINVHHPPHYTRTKLETIDVIEDMVTGWEPATAYRLGNVLKYIWRHREKGGVESLKKARFYLDREIAALEAEDGDV